MPSGLDSQVSCSYWKKNSRSVAENRPLMEVSETFSTTNDPQHIQTPSTMAPSSVKRADLVVPYIHTAPKAENAASGVINQSLPMAAMFMRNKLLSWFAMISAVQAYLGELQGEPVPEGGQSALLRIVLGIVGLGVCYLELFVPGASGGVRKKAVQDVAESISATIATAAATATGK